MRSMLAPLMIGCQRVTPPVAHSRSSMLTMSSAERSQNSWPRCFSWNAMPCLRISAMKSDGVNRVSAERANCRFSERYRSWRPASTFVKLQRPPPEMRIFSANRLA